MRIVLIVGGAAVAWAVWYAGSCWLWPFRPCRVCQGTGTHRRADRQVFRRCWWCKGAASRLRYGRRAWNHFAALRGRSR